jgi:hypothetical protein
VFALIESCERKGANYGGLILGCVDYARWPKHGFEIGTRNCTREPLGTAVIILGLSRTRAWAFFTEAIIPVMTHEDPHHFFEKPFFAEQRAHYPKWSVPRRIPEAQPLTSLRFRAMEWRLVYPIFITQIVGRSLRIRRIVGVP